MSVTSRIPKAQLRAQHPRPNPQACFDLQKKEPALSVDLIKLARKSGQLNLTGRGMIDVQAALLTTKEGTEVKATGTATRKRAMALMRVAHSTGLKPGRQKNCEGREKISEGRHHSSSCRKGPRPCSSFKEEGREIGGRDAGAAITHHGAAGKFFSPAPLQGVKRVDMACSSLPA
ncbi:uncharacterized protein LOC144151912 isoform X5 [Haemaphysalis longicornis]